MREFRKVDLGIDDSGELVVSVAGKYRERLSSLLGTGLKTVVVSDSTGYTFMGSPGNSQNPMPRTNYTVDRDDLNAVTDPSVDPILPAGIYMAGGYIDWVVDAGFLSPTGAISAWIDAFSDNLKPEGDLGLNDLSVDISEIENQIVAYPRLFQVPESTTCQMKCRFESTDYFTIVRWVFWMVQFVDLSV